MEAAQTKGNTMSEILIASDANELVSGQRALIDTMQTKIDAATLDAKSAKEMMRSMVNAGLDAAPAKRMHVRATERVHFLVKSKAALEAGYVMMPDMPGEVIAVRTIAESPKHSWRWNRGGGQAVGRHAADYKLPVGHGGYVSPIPKVEQRSVTGLKGEYLGEEHRAVSLRNPMGLDTKFIKPAVIDRMGAAMAKGIFDEIVCVGAKAQTHRPTKVKDRDPIVLGRVISKFQVSAFLIAWFMDMKEL